MKASSCRRCYAGSEVDDWPVGVWQAKYSRYVRLRQTAERAVSDLASLSWPVRISCQYPQLLV